LGGCHGAKCVCWFYEASIPVNDNEENITVTSKLFSC